MINITIKITIWIAQKQIPQSRRYKQKAGFSFCF
jgi:hypothetical protein